MQAIVKWISFTLWTLCVLYEAKSLRFSRLGVMFSGTIGVQNGRCAANHKHPHLRMDTQSQGWSAGDASELSVVTPQ